MHRLLSENVMVLYHTNM